VDDLGVALLVQVQQASRRPHRDPLPRRPVQRRLPCTRRRRARGLMQRPTGACTVQRGCSIRRVRDEVDLARDVLSTAYPCPRIRLGHRATHTAPWLLCVLRVSDSPDILYYGARHIRLFHSNSNRVRRGDDDERSSSGAQASAGE
jgi:hypothetical protein